ncbi:nucleoporin protein Ndc1-Nup [Limtongia smithiae]|uniref:nucleoporin protein Ndc1-Nup n=1 Tax=Limtongia smithiae TaxID=1125753 RepID=UPI0034CFBE70
MSTLASKPFLQTASRRPEATHYHTLYSGVLQVRFGHLARVTLITAYVTGFTINLHHSWLWAIVPVDGFFLFASIFCLYVLRKARLHVDDRVQPSLALQVYRRIFSRAYLQIALIYILCAATITLIYKQKFASLNLYLPKKEFELAKLNEKVFFCFCLGIYNALVYALVHCILDIDLVVLPAAKTDPMQRVRKLIPHCLWRSTFMTIFMVTTFPLAYGLVRGSVWRAALAVFRIFKTLHRSNVLPSFPWVPVHAVLLSFFLTFTWSFSNSLFTVYMTLGPIHRGKPISEKSSDPNGTLITGLRSSKRPFTKRTAYQELNIISHGDGRRRDSIYKDIEKPTVWSQICDECLSVIAAQRHAFELTNVNKAAKNSARAPVANAPTLITSPSSSPTPTQTKLRRGNVFLPGGPKALSPAVKLERRIVSSLQDPQATQSSAVIGWFQSGKQFIADSEKKFWRYVEEFLGSPYTMPFRYTIQRRERQLAPTPDIFADAVDALTEFVKHSLTEDTFGNVQRDITRIMDELDDTLTVFEQFRLTPPLHWSDVENKKKLINGMNPIDTPDEIYLDILLDLHDSVLYGFEEVVKIFWDYLPKMGLSQKVYDRCGVIVQPRRYIQ